MDINLKNLPKEENLNIDNLMNLTEGCNGADIKEICEKLKMIAIKKTLHTNIE